MTPYYSDDAVTIYHGDCRDILPTLDRADLILTDPPYGLGDKWQGGGGETTKTSWRFDPREAKSWDSETSDGVLALADAATYVIIWGGNYYALPPSRCWFLWDKKQNDQWTTGQAEMAWTNLDRPVRMFRLCQAEAHSQIGNKEHPTQKPLSLMSWCIAMVRDPDIATVLDPYMGSGTTLRAAKDRGYRAIGIEIDERYCEIAARRMGQEVLDFGDAQSVEGGPRPRTLGTASPSAQVSPQALLGHHRAVNAGPVEGVSPPGPAPSDIARHPARLIPPRLM